MKNYLHILILVLVPFLTECSYSELYTPAFVPVTKEKHDAIVTVGPRYIQLGFAPYEHYSLFSTFFSRKYDTANFFERGDFYPSSHIVYSTKQVELGASYFNQLYSNLYYECLLEFHKV